VNDINEPAAALSKELRALMEWEERENAKITSRLKAEGRYKIGLDTNNEAFADVRAERTRRLREIFEKYKDLPPGTKLKFW